MHFTQRGTSLLLCRGNGLYSPNEWSDVTRRVVFAGNCSGALAWAVRVTGRDGCSSLWWRISLQDRSLASVRFLLHSYLNTTHRSVLIRAQSSLALSLSLSLFAVSFSFSFPNGTIQMQMPEPNYAFVWLSLHQFRGDFFSKARRGRLDETSRSRFLLCS